MEFDMYMYNDVEQEEISAEMQHRNDMVTAWMIEDLLSQPADETAEELQEQHEMSIFGRQLLTARSL